MTDRKRTPADTIRRVAGRLNRVLESELTAEQRVEITSAVITLYALDVEPPLTRGGCPSVFESPRFVSSQPGDHHVCRYLDGHTGIHRSDDGDVRWATGAEHAHTLGVDR